MFQRFAHVTQYLFPLDGVDCSHRRSYSVRQAFPSWMRSILTEIYLCRTCSCHEILRMETPGQATSRRSQLSQQSSRTPRRDRIPHREAEGTHKLSHGESALFHLCYEGHLDMVTSQLHNVLATKWSRLGAPLFWRHTVQNAIFVILFTAWSMTSVEPRRTRTANGDGSVVEAVQKQPVQDDWTREEVVDVVRRRLICCDGSPVGVQRV
eukprot:COSAG01_NODE_243_length_20572_cov_24.956137_21_plen_209_part_00